MPSYTAQHAPHRTECASQSLLHLANLHTEKICNGLAALAGACGALRVVLRVISQMAALAKMSQIFERASLWRMVKVSRGQHND